MIKIGFDMMGEGYIKDIPARQHGRRADFMLLTIDAATIRTRPDDNTKILFAPVDFIVFEARVMGYIESYCKKADKVKFMAIYTPTIYTSKVTGKSSVGKSLRLTDIELYKEIRKTVDEENKKNDITFDDIF